MNPLSHDNPFLTDRLDDTTGFRPEWDVPSIGQAASRALAVEIETLRAARLSNPARKIHLLLGQPGDGKTHLFGRLQHEQAGRVLLVFAPHADNARLPEANVQWRLVEGLFQPDADGVSSLQRLFAQLLRPSFEAYLEQLPATLQARHAALLRRMQDDGQAAHDILRGVSLMAPYHTLAASMVSRFPILPTATLRALTLGLSPAVDDARRWLRGESLPDEQLAALNLPEDPPTPTQVLSVVATLLRQVNTRLLLCLDQLELLLQKGSQKAGPFTTVLMGWLQEIPNLLIVVGCLGDIWKKEIKEALSFKSFLDRVVEHELSSLTPEQGVELIRRRLKGRPDSRGPLWPFEEPDIKELVAKKSPLFPRGFIQLCGLAFDTWDARKEDRAIRLSGETPVVLPIVEQFQQEWNKQLEAIQRSGKAATHLQEEEIWEGCKQAMLLARHFMPEHVALLRWQDQAVKPSPADRRPSVEIHLGCGKEQLPVVLAATKKDSGQAFGRYVDALDAALGGNGLGAVVVWPTAKLGVAPTAKAFQKYQQWVKSGKVRALALDTEEQTFHRLECLRRMVNQAQAGDLQIGGNKLTPDECRKLIVETKQLANLKLFQFLFSGWPEVEKARAAVAATVPVAATSSVAASTTSMVEYSPQTVTESKPVVVAATPTNPVPPVIPDGQTGAQELLSKVIEKLRNWGQPVRDKGVEVGPTFVRLKVEPRDHTDFAKVRKQADNLKLHLGLDQRPIIEAQAGYISIDVQRPDRQAVPLQPLLPTRPGKLQGQPAFPAGVDVAGNTHWINLAESSCCHLLIAGTTGSGKSEFMKAMLAGLAESLGPDRLQFLLIDPKQVTFNFSGASPYLLKPVAYGLEEALPLIEDCVEEMERRYTLLRQRNKEHIGELTGADTRPWRVLVFDEFADLMLDRADKKATEALLKRLGAKARAAGIHLVLGTQRPEASVVTMLLRSNLPGRISLRVITERDSRLILDAPEGAHLLGKGDLLFRQGSGMVRLQSPLVTKDEVMQSLRCH